VVAATLNLDTTENRVYIGGSVWTGADYVGFAYRMEGCCSPPAIYDTASFSDGTNSYIVTSLIEMDASPNSIFLALSEHLHNTGEKMSSKNCHLYSFSETDFSSEIFHIESSGLGTDYCYMESLWYESNSDTIAASVKTSVSSITQGY
jgi:hypothetical protein